MAQWAEANPLASWAYPVVQGSKPILRRVLHNTYIIRYLRYHVPNVHVPIVQSVSIFETAVKGRE